MKRATSPLAPIQAIGILSYAISYRKICESHVKKDDSNWVPYFNEDTTLLSLKAQVRQNSVLSATELDVRARQQIRATNTRTVAFAFLASALAVWATLIQPYLKEKAFPLLEESSRYTADHAAGIFGTILLVAFFLWCLGIDVFRFPVGRDVLEAANVQRRRSTALFLVAGLLVLIVTAYYGWPAIVSISEQISAAWNAMH